MGRKRRTFSASQKTKVALEALKERMTGAEIAAKYEVHPNQVSQWKQQAIEGLDGIFSDGVGKGDQATDQSELIGHLYRQIGELQFELNWVKKKYEGAK